MRRITAGREIRQVIIAVVTPWYPSQARPVSGLFVKREVDALDGIGEEVRVIHLDRDLPDGAQARQTVGGVKVLRIGMNPANPFSVMKAVAPLRAAVVGVDVVNTHAISALPVAAAARFPVPWVHTEHWSALSSPESASALLRTVRPGFAALLRLPDVVVAESERLAAPIRQFRGNRTVELIPCIVPAPNQLVPRRNEGGDPTGSVPIRLVSTGGVIPRKNPLLAIHTLAELRDLGVDASLRWIGEGEQKSEAIRLASDLGVDAKFLGALSPQQVQEELASADIFFAPTQGENFFVAAAEALVSGRPICASDQGGHTEYADPAFSEIVSEQTPGAYAEAIIRLRDKTRGVTAAEIAATVERRFTAETVARAYVGLYGG